ncbi:DUF1803 domain-containing protein [Enterococcus sp. LJL90]
MEIQIQTQNKDLQKLAADPLLTQLFDYLWENRTDEIILRQLKQQFSEGRFEKMLEASVKAGWIERKDRRYRLLVPVVKTTEKLEATPELISAVEELKKQSIEEQAAFLYYFYQEQLTEDYLFLSETKQNFFELRQAGNDGSLLYFHLIKRNDYEPDLVDYFSFSGSGQTVPKVLKPFETLLGDVNPEYFFNQVEHIFEKVAKGKGAKLRPSIFLQAVSLSEWVTTDFSAIKLINLPELDEQLRKNLNKVSTFSSSSQENYEKLLLLDFFMENLSIKSLKFYQG